VTGRQQQSGFTLVEAMLSMVIVSIGALALQSFYAAIIRSEQLSQERLVAVHMAEQIIESWQQSNTTLPPQVDCVAGLVTLTLNTPTACTPTGSNAKAFSITANTSNAMAPMTGTGVPTWSNIPILDPYGVPTGLSPQIRTVTVSWDYKGETKSVMLTHLTRP